MFVSEISLWGAAIVACVVLIAAVALALSDKKMLHRMWVIFGATVAQMAIVVAVVWIVYQTYAWWAYLLWFLLVLVLSICWCLFPLQAMWRRMLWPVSAAMFVGSIVLGGSAMLMLPIPGPSFTLSWSPWFCPTPPIQDISLFLAPSLNWATSLIVN